MKNNYFTIIILFMFLALSSSCKKEETKDIQAPQITLLGDNPYTVGLGSVYSDPGATAIDDIDGDISGNIVVNSNVNTSLVGVYTIKFNVSDKAGNAATEAIRTVKVVITK